MNFLKSLWLKVRLPNGRLPQADVLIPMQEHKVAEVIEKPKKPRKPRAKKTGETK